MILDNISNGLKQAKDYANLLETSEYDEEYLEDLKGSIGTAIEMVELLKD